MVDDEAASPHYFKFKSAIEDIHGLCVFGTGSACTISQAYRSGRAASTQLSNAAGSDNAVDILFRESVFETAHLTKPVDVRFNNCIPPIGHVDVPMRDDFFVHKTAVHEAGHALGTSGAAKTASVIASIGLLGPIAGYFATVEYEAAHPSIPGAAMNYNRRILGNYYGEPDCSPHPFDIMAIRALYQTVP